MIASANSQPEPEKFSPWRRLPRLLPLAAAAAGALLFYAFGLHHFLTFEALREHRELLVSWVDANAVLAVLGYIAGYALIIVLAPPSGTMISLAGGLIFGVAVGVFSVVIGATIGATALFLAAKHSVGGVASKLKAPVLQKMAAGFRQNELSYMLFLRLVPLFPFWMVNIAPAFLGVSLRAYVIGTFFGIIPGTTVYVAIGAGLGSVFAANESFSLAAVMTPKIIAALSGLALLALLPVVYKKITHEKNKAKNAKQSS